jgi:hypothetical protein
VKISVLALNYKSKINWISFYLERENYMAGTIAIGVQDFGELISNNCFYIDKTSFIKEWWDNMDSVTLITRPRRFGKTLTISMLERFFSIQYYNESAIFEHLDIWKYPEYREIMGTYPVIALSFARIKENTFLKTRDKICEVLRNIYIKFEFIKDSAALTDSDRAYYDRMLLENISDTDATSAIYQMSDFLYRYYNKKVIILLDEYDTPMQEAYIDGYWDELAVFTRSLFNSTFKTNPAMERGLMTGITRVSKESIFSDLNNMEVVTTTSVKYADVYGFTEDEVFSALDEYGLSDIKDKVKRWYDGFLFGNSKDIYNPWSIINLLDKKQLGTYWANTSANGLIAKLIQEGDRNIKQLFETLLKGESIVCEIDEQIIYNQLSINDNAIWSLLLASGYLTVVNYIGYGDAKLPENCMPQYELKITNYETKLMFNELVKNWFANNRADYNDFIKAMLIGDVDAMNEYMNRITMQIFSCFDVGRKSEFAQPERFYHGFILGLLVELQDRYYLSSNRESGFGRYDIMLEPKNIMKDNAIIIEFKVKNVRKEVTLEDTVREALNQIKEKQYVQNLLVKGIDESNIKCYGMAFEGKNVLIACAE